MTLQTICINKLNIYDPGGVTLTVMVLLLLMFMQHLHVTPAELRDWICRDDEYLRLLIPANETDSELIVRAMYIVLILLLILQLWSIDFFFDCNC